MSQKKDLEFEKCEAYESISGFKNIPLQLNLDYFLGDSELRRQYFFEALKQYNVMSEMNSKRFDNNRFTLSDYINEQSQIKIWNNIQKKNLSTIDIFPAITKAYPNFAASKKDTLDASVKPEPSPW